MENEAKVVDFKKLKGKKLEEAIKENSIDYVLHTCDEYLDHLTMLGKSIYGDEDFAATFGNSPKTTQYDVDLTKPHDYEETLLKLQFSIISLLKKMMQTLKDNNYSYKSPVGMTGAALYLASPGLKAKKYSEQLDELQNNLNKLPKTENRDPALMQSLALSIWNENQNFLAALVMHNGVFNFMDRPAMLRDDLAMQHTHINATMDKTGSWYKDYTFKEAQGKHQSLQTAAEQLLKTKITPKTKLTELARQTRAQINNIEGLHSKTKSLRGSIEAKIKETKQQAEPLKTQALIKGTKKLKPNFRSLALEYIHMSIDELEDRSTSIKEQPLKPETMLKLKAVKKLLNKSDDLIIPFDKIFNLKIGYDELSDVTDIALNDLTSYVKLQIEYQRKVESEKQNREGVDKFTGFFKDGIQSFKHATHHYKKDEQVLLKNKQAMLTNINNKLAEAKNSKLVASVINVKKQLDAKHSIDGDSKTSKTLKALDNQLKYIDRWVEAQQALLKNLEEFQLKIDLHKSTYLAIAVKGIALTLVTLILTLGGALAGSLIEPGAGTLMGGLSGMLLAAEVARRATGSAASVSSGASGAASSTQDIIKKAGLEPGNENKNDHSKENNSEIHKHGDNPASLNAVKNAINMEGAPPQENKMTDSNLNALVNQ